MSDSVDRRQFLGMVAAAGLATGSPGHTAETEAGAAVDASVAGGASRNAKPFLTDAADFVDVSRGKPKPFTLEGEALSKARLTPAAWRLEIVGDKSSRVARPATLEHSTALDLDRLKELGKTHGVKYLKAMQCNNISYPLGQGLWEGVPLREVVRHVGKITDVRRIYYWGFHNNDPAQMFQSSLSYNQAMETPPWQPPPLVAYRLNGKDIPLKRGGPVRMLVPWAHGFKSIKWLQKIVLTNDYQANDTYALQNNDPESWLKTAAYIGKGPDSFRAGKPIVVDGAAMVGPSGLKRVEYWLRTAKGRMADDDPAWNTAVWEPCDLMPQPDDWDSILPSGTSAKELWGFDRQTGKPKDWPLLFSMVPWTARMKTLSPGTYEFRVRTVDLNGFAQPEPRPYQKAGLNVVPMRSFEVTA